MCTPLAIRHAVTTAYHPQSNGLVERFHRQRKEGMRLQAAGAAWLERLPWLLLGIRSAPKEDAGRSAAEPALGALLALPQQLVDPGGLAVCCPGLIQLYLSHVGCEVGSIPLINTYTGLSLIGR